MTTPEFDDPRTGVTIPAGTTVLHAAAAIQGWLYDNTNSTHERAQFVIELNNLMTDYDFTLACIKGLAAELPEREL